MRQLRLVTATALASVAAIAAGCGGGDERSSDASAGGNFTARSAEFSLGKRSDVGTKDAYVTFTSRSDGKTTAVVDFYVPRTPEAKGDVYPVAMHEGACSSPGETTISLGDLSAGMTVLVLDEGFDEAVTPINDGDSSVVIMKPDRKTIAWCGPSS